LTIETDEPERLIADTGTVRLHGEADGRRRRIEQTDGHRCWQSSSVSGVVKSVTLGKPTLEDVFINRTDHPSSAGSAATAAELRPQACEGATLSFRKPSWHRCRSARSATSAA
jgi:hypothetical protein